MIINTYRFTIENIDYVVGPEDYMKKGRKQLQMNSELALSSNSLKDRQYWFF